VMGRRTRQALKYLTEQELQSLFSVIKNVRDRAIFMLAFWRGLRPSEIGLLRLDSWHPKTNRLFVRRLKGSISQDYRLNPEEERALRTWLRVRGKVPGLLFGGYKNRGLGRRQLDRLMKHYGELAGIPEEKRHMHALKHSCATFLVDHDEPIHLVQDHLGHRDIKSTLVYAQVTPRKRDEMADRLSELRVA